MRSLVRFLGVFLAIISVSALGYYAYILGVETLRYPFLGSDTQRGMTLDMLVSRPSFPLKMITGPILDIDALRDSITLLPSISGERENTDTPYTLVVSGERIIISASGGLREGSSLTIDTTQYNDMKTTKYRLPRDMTLTVSEKPKNLTIEKIGLPRESTYHVSMSGFDVYTPENIRYYISYSPDASCSYPVSLTEYSSIFPQEIVPMTRDGQRMDMRIRFDIDHEKPYVCLIGSVNGIYSVLEDRPLTTLTIIPSTLDMLSPEYDMQSRIEFRFSHPFYEDQGSPNSPEYLAHREDEKLGFLKHLSLSTDMPVNPENIVITPYSAIVTLPLRAGVPIDFSLADMPDIHGRHADTHHTLTPTQNPFLSLRLAGGSRYYHLGESIRGKLYALGAPKKSYTLKLCQVPLESYSQIEQMLTRDTLTGASLDAVYTLMSGSLTLGCIKKDIDLTSTGYTSAFDAQDFVQGRKLRTGLYIMTFMYQEDIAGFQKIVAPIIFSVLDSHITMKVDPSGEFLFLVTDSITGKPLKDQEILIRRNITRTYTEYLDTTTNQRVRADAPPLAQAFSTGKILGNTDADGFLRVHLDRLEGIAYAADPYSLTFENGGEYEGRYESFLIESRSSDRLGYLVSTWNDGMTGYDAGIQRFMYSMENQERYTAYLHTDKTHYLPGERVSIHAIIRENTTALRIPTDFTSTLIVSDGFGREISRAVMRPNEFGTLSSVVLLPDDAPFGQYTVSIVPLDQTAYITGGSTEFQVEHLSVPTFTPQVTLRSPDIEDGSIRNLRKKKNTRADSPWYSDIYEGKFSLEGIVKGVYADGLPMRNTTFTYTLYRDVALVRDRGDDCIDPCDAPSTLEYITEGSGVLDRDGLGVLREDIDYISYHDDYDYIARVTLRDPLTGDEITTSGSLMIRLPISYKTFSSENALEFRAKKQVLQNGESIQGVIYPRHGQWDSGMVGKYGYQIIHRVSRRVPADAHGSRDLYRITTTDTIMASGTLITDTFSQKLIAYPPGAYLLQTFPLTRSGAIIPDTARSESEFSIIGNALNIPSPTVRVIPEKPLYAPGEMARVFLTVPFTGSLLLLTLERGGMILEKRYFSLSGTTFTYEHRVDDTLLPNTYIGVTAITPTPSSALSRYSVGYGEIRTDITEKGGNLIITPDKSLYKNTETVSIDLILTDRSGNPLPGEIALTVTSESMSGSLAGSSPDMIARFYRHVPLALKTSLTAIGIMTQSWLSQKGNTEIQVPLMSMGERTWSMITPRKIAGATLFYNPSIRTDLAGKARITFTLPDMMGDVRIRAIGNTKDSHFAYAEKVISIRKDYHIVATTPIILHSGDISQLGVQITHTTNKITATTLTVSIGTAPNILQKSVDIILNPHESVSRIFPLESTSIWGNIVPYRVELREKNTLLDSFSGSFGFIPITPRMSTYRNVLVWSGTILSVILPQIGSGGESRSSRFSLDIAPSTETEIRNGWSSLMQGGHGTIDEMIGSALAQVSLERFSEKLKIPTDTIDTHAQHPDGLTQILRMQHPDGGWKYLESDRESDIDITPYVLRSLLELRSLGQSIPDTVLDRGADALVRDLSRYRQDENILSEIAWTLALLGRTPIALELWKSIDAKNLERQGYLAYVSAGRSLGLSLPDAGKNLDMIMFSTGNTQRYGSSEDGRDAGLYVQYLIEGGEYQKAGAMIDRLIQSTDLSAATLSIQAKVQILSAFLQYAEKGEKPITKNLSMAFRSDALIADASLSPSKLYRQILTTRDRVGGGFTLKRDDARLPIYVTVTLDDRTKDITDMVPVNTFGMNMARTFEYIDESKGKGGDGKYLSATPVTDGIFSRGGLYRVTIKSFLPIGEQYYTGQRLMIEDYVPGGWSPIIAQQDTLSTTQRFSDRTWKQGSIRGDMIFAVVDTGNSNTYTHSYYIRPETGGSYLIPPAYGFFIDHPEVRSMTRYEKIQVKEPLAISRDQI